MTKQTFTGWIEHIFNPTDYDQQIAVANYRDDNHKQKMVDAYKAKTKGAEYPQCFCFKANIKSGAAAQFDGLNIGDKVEISYVLSGMSGTSKKNNSYYCINSLMVMKTNGVKILEQVAAPDASADEQVDDSDIPF